MKTAEEVLNEQYKLGDGGSVFNEPYFREQEIKSAMIYFAKMHVEQALKEQSEYITNSVRLSNVFAYNLSNIK